MTEVLHNRTVLVTGGAGAFGRAYVRHALEAGARKVIVFSRDEAKHDALRRACADPRLRFFLGDVRDRDRLTLAFRGVDYVIHAAALKVVPAGEYDPFEFVQTNVIGAENVARAAIDCGVRRVVALSTDKAAAPANLYGATKMCAEKLFIAANAYSGADGTVFACTRYGNVSGSTASVIPIWRAAQAAGRRVELTDERMSRYWMTMGEAVGLVTRALSWMRRGDIYIPRLRGYTLRDLALAMGVEYDVTGIRPGEKLREVLITRDEARNAHDIDGAYVISPPPAADVRTGFDTSASEPRGERITEVDHTSETAAQLSVDELRAALAAEGL